MPTRYISIVLFAALVIGCSAKTYPPVSMDAAKAVKSGTPLDEVVKSLGEPHPPTAKQAAQLNEMISKMPEPMRTNGQNDKSLAWGDDKGFLAVKVNDKGAVWITTWASN